MKKSVLITGATNGLGEAIARSLEPNNFELWLHGRNAKKLRLLKNQLSANALFEADLNQTENLTSTCKNFISEVGCPDVLILNAGLGYFDTLDAINENLLETSWRVNVLANQIILNNFLPHFKAKKSGLIIAILSDAAKKNFPTGGVYNATKAAMHATLASLRHEVQTFGIKISCLYPGLINTNFADSKPEEHNANDKMEPRFVAETVKFIINQPQSILIEELILRPINQPSL